MPRLSIHACSLSHAWLSGLVPKPDPHATRIGSSRTILTFISLMSVSPSFLRCMTLIAAASLMLG